MTIHHRPLTIHAQALKTLNRFELLHQIAHEGLRPDVPAASPTALTDLTCECWAGAERDRPTSAEVVKRLRECYHAQFGYEWRLSEGAPAMGCPSGGGGQSSEGPPIVGCLMGGGEVSSVTSSAAELAGRHFSFLGGMGASPPESWSLACGVPTLSRGASFPRYQRRAER